MLDKMIKITGFMIALKKQMHLKTLKSINFNSTRLGWMMTWGIS